MRIASNTTRLPPQHQEQQQQQQEGEVNLSLIKTEQKKTFNKISRPATSTSTTMALNNQQYEQQQQQQQQQRQRQQQQQQVEEDESSTMQRQPVTRKPTSKNSRTAATSGGVAAATATTVATATSTKSTGVSTRAVVSSVRRTRTRTCTNVVHKATIHNCHYTLSNQMIRIYFLYYLLFCTTNIVCGLFQCVGPRSHSELREALWGSKSGDVNGTNLYDKRTRPNFAYVLNHDPYGNPGVEAEPDIAQVQLHVIAMKDLNQKLSEFQVLLLFSEKWEDYRLKFDDRFTTSAGGCFEDGKRQSFLREDLKEIWKPNIMFANGIKEDEISSNFWIHPSGFVTHVRYLLLTLSCNMDFRKFPHDTQVCDIIVSTFREDETEITLTFWDNNINDDSINSQNHVVWDINSNNDNNDPLGQNDGLKFGTTGGGINGNVIDPITIANSDELGNGFGGSSEWKILSVNATNKYYGDGINLFFRKHGGAMLTVQEDMSYLFFTFRLKREHQHYTDFVILPTILIVSIGWSSFFIDRKAAPARVALSIICFLTNMNFLGAQISTIPRLSNEVWLLKFLTISMIFTFYCVVEYVLCNYLHRIQGRINKGRNLAIKKMTAEAVKKKKQREEEEERIQHSSKKVTILGSGEAFFDCGSSDSDLLSNNDNNQNGFPNDLLPSFTPGGPPTTGTSFTAPVTKRSASAPASGSKFSLEKKDSFLSKRTWFAKEHNKKQSINNKGTHNLRLLMMQEQTLNADPDVGVINPTKQDLINHGFTYRMDLIILKKDGEMRFKDEHIDIFSRYIYPVAYAICIAVLWSVIDDGNAK